MEKDEDKEIHEDRVKEKKEKVQEKSRNMLQTRMTISRIID